MPRYTYNGKTYNVPDDKVAGFLTRKPNAKPLESGAPMMTSVGITSDTRGPRPKPVTLTPRESDIPKSTGGRAEQNQPPRPYTTQTGGQATFSDGVGQLPALRMPQVPQIDTTFDPAAAFRMKSNQEVIGESILNYTPPTDVLFDRDVQRYADSGDYERDKGKEIGELRTPALAHGWLEKNKPQRDRSKGVLTERWSGERAERKATEQEQADLINRFLAFAPEGQAYAREYEEQVKWVDGQIAELKAKIADAKENGPKISVRHSMPGDTFMPNLIENEDVPENYKDIATAETRLEELEKLRADAESGDWSGFRKFWNEMGRRSPEGIADIATLGMYKPFANAGMNLALQDPERELTKEADNLLGQWQALHGHERSFAADLANGTYDSLAFMAQFAGTGGISAAAVKGMSTAIAKKLGGTLVAKAVGKTSKVVGEALVRTVFAPSTIAGAYELNTQNPGSFLDAYSLKATQNFIEFLSEGMGAAIPGGRLLGRARKSYGKTIDKILDGARAVGKHTGIQSTGIEYLEEQFATFGHSLAGDGQANWADFVDPRSQALTLASVALLQLPNVTISAAGYGAGKARNVVQTRSIRKGYDSNLANMKFVFAREGASELISDIDSIADQMASDMAEITKKTGTAANVNEDTLRELVDAVSDDMKLNDSQKSAIVGYIKARAAYSGLNQAKSEEIEAAVQSVAPLIDENVNPDMGAIVAIKIAGVETPVHNVAGKIERRDDGSIDDQKSDAHIFYTDPEGKRQVADIRHVEEVTELIPREQAVAQMTEMATAPIIARQENEEVRPYEAGERVRLANGMWGHISSVDQQTGNYIVEVATAAGVQQIPAEPRHIINEDNLRINEDNLRGVENESVIVYMKDGERREGVVATNDDAYARGEIILENSDVVPIADVIGLAEEWRERTDAAPGQAQPVRLNEQQATDLIARMERDAVDAPVLELTPANWIAEFGGEDGAVSTPLGEVKMGANQYLKMQTTGRGGQFGMVKPTLTEPDIVIEEDSRENSTVSERGTNLLFIKTFRDASGQKYTHFESVTVSVDKKEVVVSSHIIRPKQLLQKFEAGRVVYRATALNASGQTFAEYTSHTDSGAPQLNQSANGSELRLAENQNGQPDLVPAQANYSENKGSTNNPKNQIEEIIAAAPKQKNGRVDYDALLESDPEAFATLYESKVGAEATLTQLKAVSGSIAKKITSAQAALDNADSINKRMDAMERVAELGERKARVDGIINERYPDPAAAQENIPNFRERLAAVRGMASATVRGRVLYGIASGEFKFRWSDSSNSPGVARELGVSSSSGEFRAKFGILRNDGYTPETLAERLSGDNMLAPTAEYDPIDARSEIIDILNSINTANDALSELEAMMDDGNPFVGMTEEEYAQYQAYQAERMQASDGVSPTVPSEEEDYTEPAPVIEESTQSEPAPALESTPKAVGATITPSSEVVPKYDVRKNDNGRWSVDKQVNNGPWTFEMQFGSKREADNYVAEKLKPFQPQPSRPDSTQRAMRFMNVEDQIARAEAETDTNPTEAQKQAGNYKKGHVTIQGLPISIENPKGSTRSGVDESGREWSQEMKNTYGYIGKTESKDGDHIDVFLGENSESDMVFVVDQVDPITGAFDEHKVMLGFDTIEQARAAYLSNYEEGWLGLGGITGVGVETFRAWTETEGRRVKPFADYKAIQEGAPEAMVPLKKQSRAAESLPAAKITDFGEKIGGARKDVAVEYKKTLSEITPESIASQPLSKIFPRPNFKALVQSGALSQGNAAYLSIVYDDIPTKPRTPHRLRRWVNEVYKAKSEAERVLGLNEEIDRFEFAGEALRRMRGSTTYYKQNKPYEISPEQAMWLDSTWMRMATLKALGFPLSGVKTGGYEVRYEVAGPENIFYLRKGDKRVWGTTFQTFEDAIDYVKSQIDSPAKKETVFNIYYNRKEKIFYVGKPIQGKAPVRLSETFADSGEAQRYLRDHRDEIQAKWDALNVPPEERRSENRIRRGRDYREGKDVTPEQFQTEFGFRGTEFGNWVNQSERQQALNDAYDALMDLAGVLRISPRAVSLGGKLGMAFGARGSGNAGGTTVSAHYEPVKVVINLTKTRGSGTLAHEWWHALDNYFSRMGGNEFDYITEVKAGEGVRDEMVRAYAELVQSIKDSGVPARSAELDSRRSKNYWSTPSEMSARAFEAFVIEKLVERSDSNDYLANYKTLDEWLQSGRFDMESYPYPTEDESHAINEKYSQLFDAIGEHVDEVTGDTVLFQSMPAEELEAVNARFNEDLETLTSENADSVILDLGNPSDVLQSAGIEANPLKLYGNKLASKAAKHGFAFTDIKDLPRAISRPIAVFKGGTEGGYAILTELKIGNNNVLATITVGKGFDVDFNIVSSVYGKTDNKIVKWINDGKLLYADKEKTRNYLHFSLRKQEPQTVSGIESATKIIQSFENPKLQQTNSHFATIGKKVFDRLVERLKRTGLAKEVITDTAQMREKLAEILGKDGAARFLSLWHGSPYLFDRFSLETGGEANGLAYGFGVYLTGQEHVALMFAKQGGALYGVEINDNLNLLQWRDPLTVQHREAIIGALEALKSNEEFDPIDVQTYINSIKSPRQNSGGVYGGLASLLGGQREASDFLQKIGINGIEYQSGRLTNPTPNYVIFDAAAVKITETTRLMSTPTGDVYGFTLPDGTVYLDGSRMNANTPIHEFAHLWNTMIRENNPELWARGAKLVRESVYWQRVNDNPTYRDLTDEQKEDEALAMAIGDKGAAAFNHGDVVAYGGIKGWIWQAWEWIKSKLGIARSVNIEDMTLGEFTDHALGQLLGGKKLQNSNQSPIFAGVNNSDNDTSADSGTETRMDNRQTVGGGALREALGEQPQVHGIARAAEAADRGGIESAVRSAEEREELESRGINNSENGNEADISERLPQGAIRGRIETSAGMEQETSHNRAGESATGHVRQAASRERSKKGQLTAIERAAKEAAVWIDDPTTLGDYFSEGGENEVYYNPSENKVYKVNNFEYAGDDVSDFFARIDAHNDLFGNVPYKIIGFSRNSKGEVSAVLEQPYVEAEREATEDEIVSYMEQLGFEADGTDSFDNGKYNVFDAVPNNVLVGKDGRLYFIDTQISVADTDLEQDVTGGEIVRFQSVSDVADTAPGERAFGVEERRDAIDRKIRSFKFRWKEAHQDRHIAIKYLLDELRAAGVEIPDYNDLYMQATHLNSKDQAQMEIFKNQYHNPLAQAIRALIDADSRYRDIENYIILKHGIERNVWMRKDEVERYRKENPKATDAQIAQFAESIKTKDYAGVTAVEAEVNTTAGIFITDFEQRVGQEKIDELWKRINAATAFSLKKGYESGHLTKAQYEEIESRYEWYIPLRGHDKETAEDKWDYGVDMGTYFVSPFVRAKGRKSRSSNPFGFIYSMAQTTIKSANANIWRQGLLRLAQQDKTGLMSVSKAWYVNAGYDAEGKPVFETQSPAYSENPEQYRKNIEAFEARMKSLQEIGQAFQGRRKLNIGGIFIKPSQAAQHEVRVMQNGEEYVVYINANPAIARAINGSNVEEKGAFLEAVSKATRPMAANFTTRNPLFMLTNFERDFHYSTAMLLIKEGGKYALQFEKNLPASFGALQRYVRGKMDLTNQADVWANEYILNGGKTGYSHTLELQTIEKRIGKEVKRLGRSGVVRGTHDVLHATLEGLQAMNDVFENATRLSVYITSREMGRSVIRSIDDAKNVTVNFNKKGTGALGANAVNSLWVFNNATIQSLANYLKVAAAHPGKIAAQMTFYTLWGALPYMMAWAMGGDDGLEEYMRLGDWERQNNLCIPDPFGVGFMKFALPHELRVFYKMGDNAAMAFMGRKDWDDAIMESAVGLFDLIPLNPLEKVSVTSQDFRSKSVGELALNLGAMFAPEVMKPVAELAANRSFTGGQITNRWAGAHMPGFRKVRTDRNGEAYAPDFLVSLSEWLNSATRGDNAKRGVISFNPDDINHLMRGYFGGLYTTISKMADTIDKLTDGEKGNLKFSDTPFSQFYTSKSNMRMTSNALDSRYYKAVDGVEETRAQAKAYANEIGKSLTLEQYAQKLNELDYGRAERVNGVIKEIRHWQDYLKEVEREDRPRIDRKIAELKQQAVDIYREE